jgi:hypothetical protein
MLVTASDTGVSILQWGQPPRPLPQETSSPAGLKTFHQSCPSRPVASSSKASKAGTGLPIQLVCTLRCLPPFLQTLLKTTVFPSLPHRKRGAQKDRGLRNCHRELADARNSRCRHLEWFIPLFIAIFSVNTWYILHPI